MSNQVPHDQLAMSSGYHIEIPPRTELQKREIELRLTQLRAMFAENERWFMEPKEIVDYLNVLGFRQSSDRYITTHTLTAWKKRLGFPYAKRKRQKIATPLSSNLMIAAWAWSLR